MGEESTSEEIVVIAERFRGSVDVPQPPLVTLDEEEIAAYGASSLADLLESLAPQTGSGRGRGGRPVVLVNGQRLSGFRELRHYPPEAIRRIEVLPEEVALRFGYPADQRVVNFILKDNFSSREVELEYNQPWAGGNWGSEIELTWLTIDGSDRLKFNAQIEDNTLLTEAERGVIQPTDDVPGLEGDPDPARYRSLVDDSLEAEFDATWTKGLGDDAGSFTINANILREEARKLSGLDTVVLTAPDGSSLLRSLNDDQPLERDRRSTTYAMGATLNKPVDGWQLDATLDANHVRSRTLIDRRADTAELAVLAASGALAIDAELPALPEAGRDEALTRTSNIAGLITFAGTALALPAGDVSTTFDLGYAWDGIRSEDTRNPGVMTDLERGDLSAGFNLAFPVASKRRQVWGALGDISLNFSGGINRLSDFGTLTDWSAGISWNPTSKLSFQASYITRQAAPSLNNLGDPEIILFNEPVFDFTRGESVLATLTTGGNPALIAETQRDIKLGATWELPVLKRSNLVVEYFRNRSDDVTAAFPLLTPAIEAAFPERVTRDDSGRLVAIDQRPVTFAERDSARLQIGLNLSGEIGRVAEQDEKGRSGGDRPNIRTAFRGGGDGKGRWNMSLVHTIELSNDVLVASGGPLLDLLGGDALSGGGVPRHSLTLEGGAYWKGIGLRVSGDYQGATHVDGGGLAGSSDLHFGDIAKFDMRLFVDLGRRKAFAEMSPLFKDMRIVLRVDNIFDAQQRVTDQTGVVPLRYQPALIDPVGRYFEIELRKVF